MNAPTRMRPIAQGVVVGNYGKYLFAFGAALAWGFGANFAKMGMREGPPGQ